MRRVAALLLLGATFQPADARNPDGSLTIQEYQAIQKYIRHLENDSSESRISPENLDVEQLFENGEIAPIQRLDSLEMTDVLIPVQPGLYYNSETDGYTSSPNPHVAPHVDPHTLPHVVPHVAPHWEPHNLPHLTPHQH